MKIYRRSKETKRARAKREEKQQEWAEREKELRIRRLHSSPFTGIRFPEGSKRIAFLEFVQQQGSFQKTRAALRVKKSMPDGRVPNLTTLKIWARDQHWQVLRLMVDDGIYDFLQAQDDPDIKEVIKDDAGFFKILMRLRSTLVMQLSEPNSPLMPRNTQQLVPLLRLISDELGGINQRMSEADRRSVGDDADRPDNVVAISQYLQEKDVPVTETTVAREIMRRRRAAAAEAEA